MHYLDKIQLCNYNNYVTLIGGVVMQSKLIKIGNSKGIGLPKKLIEKYHLNERLTLEETNKGILINPYPRYYPEYQGNGKGKRRLV